MTEMTGTSSETVILAEGTVGLTDQLGAQGENEFLVFSRQELGPTNAMNRVVRFTRASTVLLLSAFNLPGLSDFLLSEDVGESDDSLHHIARWGSAAVHNLKQSHFLGMIIGGVKGNSAEGAAGDLALARHSVLVVKRSVYLELGGVIECEPNEPQEDNGNSWNEFTDLAARMWIAGYKVSAEALPLGWIPTAGNVAAQLLDVAVVKAALKQMHASAAVANETYTENKSALKYHEDAKHKAVQLGLVVNCDTSISKGIDSHAVDELFLNGMVERNSNTVDMPTYPRYCTTNKSRSSSTSARPFHSQPHASLLLQYFKRAANIRRIMAAIKASLQEGQIEVIINNDSKSDDLAWLETMPYKGSITYIMVYSNDLHEIRGYNRLGTMADSEALVMMQDDDVPKPNSNWLRNTLTLFHMYPRLGMIGGYRGRMDDGKKQKANNANDGSKFGAEPHKDKLRVTKHIPYREPTLDIPFMWIYKVNMGPLMVRRSWFTHLGNFHLNFSCPGDPGIGFDYEFSVRLWKFGATVALYDALWTHHVHEGVKLKSLSKGSAAQNPTAVLWVNEKRNNAQLYKMYPTLHHKSGTSMAAKLLSNLSKVKSASFSTKSKNNN